MGLIATDRLDLIQLFLRVAEVGQISEAARSLGISQPTASRFLQRLEALLGTPLVDRSPQGLSLTQAGRDFVDPARRLIDGWHEATDGANADKRTVSGRIRVAAPIAAGQGFLAAIAAGFVRNHPHVELEWHLRDDAVDVITGGYDLWIRAGEMQRDDIVVRQIYRVERSIVAAPVGAATTHPEELRCRAAVRLSTFVPSTIELTNDGEKFRLRQKAVFTTDNLYAARTAVLEGVGYAVLPLWCVQAQLSQGALIRICEPWQPPAIMLSLAYAPSRSRSTRVAALIRHFREGLQDDLGLGVAFIREMGASSGVTHVKP